MGFTAADALRLKGTLAMCIADLGTKKMMSEIIDALAITEVDTQVITELQLETLDIGDITLSEVNGCLETQDYHAHGDPPVAGFYKMQQGTTPAAHAEAGHSLLWSDDDGKLYLEDEAGADIEIGVSTLEAYTPTITGTSIGMGQGEVNPINWLKETLKCGGVTKVTISGRFDSYQEDDPVTIDFLADMSAISHAQIGPNSHDVYDSLAECSISGADKIIINRSDGISGQSIVSVHVVGIE